MQIILGYFLVAFSVVCFLSTASFSPLDSTLFVSLPQVPAENIVGRLGAALSSYLILLYGQAGSLLLSFGILVTGINVLIKAKIGRILLRISLFFIAVIALSVLIALFKNDAGYVNSGMMGLMMTRSLLEVMPRGLLIGIFGLLFLLSLSATMKLFRHGAMFFARTLGLVVLAPFRLLGLVKGPEKAEAHVPELDTEFENPVPGIKSRPVTYESEAPQPVLNEAERFPVKREEPDFLRTPAARLLEETAVSEQIYNGMEEPAFLLNDTEKQRIMHDIHSSFQPLIYDHPVTTRPPLINRNAENEEVTAVATTSPLTEKKEDTTPLPPPVKTEEKAPVKKAEKSDQKSAYYFPKTSMLEQSFQSSSREEIQKEIEQISQVIETTFENFKIDIKVTGYSRGPAITRYEMVPPVGLKLKNIINLQDDLALNLGTKHIRIVAPIGNQSLVGVEVPNQHRQSVALREMVEREEFKNSKAHLPLILGKSISGQVLIEDLTEMPHLLIAGTTGSGKSVYVNCLISGLLFRLREDELKFIMIDPKMVELELYNGIPHLLAPVITQPEEALAALEWAVKEMDRRYQVLSDFGVRSIFDYNKYAKDINVQRQKDKEEEMEVLPFIIIVIDEFANLMLRSPKETEKIISRLAAMARAVGIHLVIATQRPSVDVVTGIIKANFPSRIAFRVSSRTDSRTILDKNGAESLLGRGDMLFLTPSSTDIFRIQAPFVSNADVESIVSDLKRNGSSDYQIDFEKQMEESLFGEENPGLTVDSTQDPLFGDALKTAVANGEISASYLQRKFRVGYNRASRLVEAMDHMGILGPSTGNSKPREVLINQEDLVHYL